MDQINLSQAADPDLQSGVALAIAPPIKYECEKNKRDQAQQ